MQHVGEIIPATVALRAEYESSGVREVLDRATEGPVRESNRYVATWNAGFLASADMMEAISATLEKREAKYTGR